ncbi:hypothetical protein PQR33_35995 [Paraburkholderia sediminicola]|uniref:hypothetical protein n=1 Tax=Paraburkholderia sediminicola TaxID=458836 RepID=UPI0038BA8AAB
MATTDEFPNLIGTLYGRWTLDGVVELAYAVSLDFVARPHKYVSGEIPAVVSDLRVAYGTDKHFQNTLERQAMILPILGRSDALRADASVATSSFHMARKIFLDACSAFTERAVDTGVEMLEQRVRSSLVTFQAHFDGLRGTAAQVASKLLGQVFVHATDILKANGVAKVFGQDAADGDWPLESNDSNGAKLVDAIGTSLVIAADYKLTYTRFILLQQVAQEGSRVLPLVLASDPNSDSDLSKLITQGYAWGASLRDYQQSQ